MRRVISIDPGSVVAGYAVLDKSGSTIKRVTSGVIRCGKLPFAERLAVIYDRVAEVCATHRPNEGAIEAIFFQKNAQSALKLGHARAAAMLAMVHAGLTVAEYEPSLVKKTVTGRGAADKAQVAAMVAALIGFRDAATADESDALAIGLCHLQQNLLMPRGAR